MRDEETEYHVQISAKHRWFDLKLDEVWAYRDLILLFTKKSFTVRYKQTILGPLWLLINPIMSSLMYTVILGHIAGLSTDGVPKLLFYLTGNAKIVYLALRRQPIKCLCHLLRLHERIRAVNQQHVIM